MPTASAGLLMYRGVAPAVEVLLVHPGGPLWARKDLGTWTIPKGQIADNEEPRAAAQREFAEETGFPVTPPFLPLGSIRQQSGKVVHAWAFAGDCDPAALRSNTFAMEWPPRSGQRQTFPEIDRAGFFAVGQARAKLHVAQLPFLDRLLAQLATPLSPG